MSVPSFSVSPAEYLFQGSAGRPANSNPSKMRHGDCIVQPSSKKRAIVDSNAEQDRHSNARPSSSKQAMIDSSAERPAHRRDNPRIAYIYCPRWCWHREPELMLRALEHAMTVASTIINVVFDNENDAKHLKLKDIWNEKFATLSVGALVSLYSKDSWQLLSCQDTDPICKSSCVMLTFSGRAFPFYRLTVIAVAFPAVPRAVRHHILDVCVDKAIQTNSDAIIIGGFFNSNVLWLENHVCKLDLDIAMSANNELYVLPWCASGIMKCIALDSKGPFTLVIEHVQSSAEPPAKPTSRNVCDDPSSSAVPPVRTPAKCPSPPPQRFKPNTPLYDQFLADLEEESQSEDASSLIEYIQQFCFFGELCYLNPSGERFDQPVPLSQKMEDLLLVVSAQRRRIATASRLDQSSLSHHRATDLEMKEMINAWRNDVASWMCISTQDVYWNLKRKRSQHALQFTESRFTTYCFQISGSRFLLHKLIELPIVRVGSAARPASSSSAAIKDLLMALQHHKETDQYKNEVLASTKRLDSKERTSQQIWWARANLERGKTLAKQRDAGSLSFFDLGCKDQELVEKYDGGKAERILCSLQAARSPVYRGTHVEAFTSLFTKRYAYVLNGLT